MIFKSILGGLMIAFASYIYLMTGGIIGAFLFSIGLLIILNMGFKLFTGTVGFIKTTEDIIDNVVIFIGNLIGTCGILCFPAAAAPASVIVASKLATPSPLVFVNGVFCGMLIYMAVVAFKNHKDNLVPLCVAAFILIGAEHCIADMCYLLAAKRFTAEAFIFLAIVISGNILGALLIDKIFKI